MSQLTPLADLPAFEALDPTQRMALAAHLAGSLGKDFQPHTTLVGTKGMVAVDHQPTGVQLVAIPGGAFEMGLTDNDEVAIRACVDYDSAVIQSHLQRFEQLCSPVHHVAVSPFLLSVAHLTSAQAAAVTGGILRFDILSSDDALRFSSSGSDFRLPSEAELEYAGREGGAVAFLNDGGRLWSKTRKWPEPSGWGLSGLSYAAWAADEWHDDYVGAPATSIPWSAGGRPAVYRGGLMHAPETEEELLFGLAAYRGRMQLPDDEWDVGLRVAQTIAV